MGNCWLTCFLPLFLSLLKILIFKLVSTKIYLMSLYPMVIHREEKSLEEKFCLDAKVRGEAETERKDVCPVVTWYNEKHFYMERILSLVI